MKTIIVALALLAGACNVKNPLYCWTDHPCDVALQQQNGLSPMPYCNLVQHECHATPQDAPDLATDAADLAVMPPDLATLPDFSQPDFAPPPPHFNPDIQADIDRLGCAAAGCHAVTPPLLVASPSSIPLYMQNWQNFRADVTVDMGAASALILTKPLAGDGVKHNGSAATFKAFADTNDPVYVRWLRWVNEGSVY